MSARDFRFQPLLDWAEQREEQQMLVLATVLAEEQAARAALDGLVRAREDELVRLSATRGVDPHERQAAETYLLRLQSAIEAQRGAVEEARGRADQARATLVELEQEKQSLERLRERDEHAALEEQNRREASAVDDLNMARHARRPDGSRGVA